MAEIPKGTTGTKEVKHDKGKEWKRQSARKTKEQEEEKYKRPVLPVLPSRLSQRLSSRYSEEEYHGEEDPGKDFEEGNIRGAGLKPQGYRFYAQSSSEFKEKHMYTLEGKQQSARKTKEQEEEKYKLPALRYLAAPLRMLSSRYSEEEYYEGKPQSARMTTKQEEHQSLLTFLKHGRRISSEIDDLSLLVPVTNKMLPDQLHSLMEKLIEEQKQLVNLLQEMATSVKQRGTYRLLDPYASEDSSKLNVLLSKIHLVSLKLNLQRMKSVDEAQVKTDTKVSEKQHHDVEKAHSTLQTALKELGKAMKSGDTFRVSPFEKYDTQRYMTVSVYYCQQMLVDDLQALVPQTILVKEPVYHKQYMENLNVLIKTQQQLVQNLTGLQKQKKGSKLEKESPKQDDLSGGEIGKQQLNELELITEQTDLIKDLLHLIHLHENHYSHEAFFVICSLHMVTSVHDRSVMETWTDVIERRIRYTCTSMMYGIKGEHVLNEQMIMQSQRRFLDTVEVWNKRQTSEERKHMIFSAGYQSMQDDPTKEPELKVIHSRMGEMSVSDKEDEKISIESRKTAQNTLKSDGIDKSVYEDSNLSAAGNTSTTQTTQAVSLMTPRNDEQAVKGLPL